MPFRIYYLEGWRPITDPVEIQIAKTAVLRSLRTEYTRIWRRHGPPKALKWVIWWVFFRLPYPISDHIISGYFHCSDTEITPHWTLRGFDHNGIARITYHIFPWGTNAHFGFSNGGRYWAGRRLRASQCRRIWLTCTWALIPRDPFLLGKVWTFTCSGYSILCTDTCNYASIILYFMFSKCCRRTVPDINVITLRSELNQMQHKTKSERKKCKK